MKLFLPYFNCGTSSEWEMLPTVSVRLAGKPYFNVHNYFRASLYCGFLRWYFITGFRFTL